MTQPEVIELNRIRLDEDLTHREIAEQLGITEAGINRVLRYKVQPRDRTLHKIRRFLTQHAERQAAARKRQAKRAS